MDEWITFRCDAEKLLDKCDHRKVIDLLMKKVYQKRGKQEIPSSTFELGPFF